MKLFINFAFSMSVVGGLVLLITPARMWPDFYDAKFLGAMGLISAAVIILPKYVFRTGEKRKQEAVQYFQSAIALAFLLGDIGSLYLYRLHTINIQYDKILHLVTPFIFTIVLAIFWQVWRDLPLKRALVWAVITVFCCGLIWELLEFLSDFIFHTTAFGIGGQYLFLDTSFDLMFDWLGIFIATRVIISPNFNKFVAGDISPDEIPPESVRGKEKAE